MPHSFCQLYLTGCKITAKLLNHKTLARLFLQKSTYKAQVSPNTTVFAIQQQTQFAHIHIIPIIRHAKYRKSLSSSYNYAHFSLAWAIKQNKRSSSDALCKKKIIHLHIEVYWMSYTQNDATFQ